MARSDRRIGQQNVSVAPVLCHGCLLSASACVRQGWKLEIRDDGGGIADLKKALAFAGSTKVERTNFEIGQYGKGLKLAVWHLGDDCLILTV